MREDKHGKEDDKRKEQTESHNSTPKTPLASLLLVQKTERGLRLNELAALIGIREPYMSQLLSGKRQFASLSFEALRAIAALLGMRPVLIFMMAGVLEQADLYVSRSEAEAFLEMGIRRIAESAYAKEASVGLADLLVLSEEVKLLLIFLHQTVTKSGIEFDGTKRWKKFERTPNFCLRINKAK